VKLHYDGTRTVEGITFTLTDRKTGVVTRYVPESAAATPAASWDGGPTVTAMMRGVEDAAIEWVKCVVDYNASCQAAPPPSGLEASEAVRKAGHKCELAYGYFQKAITALADHRATPAPSALKPGSPQHVAIWDAINEVVAASGGSTSTTNIARQKAVVSVERALREALVQATSALDRLRERVFGWSMTSMLGEDASQALRMVLRWIDEEREREAKR
jgi:hypothetical protein